MFWLPGDWRKMKENFIIQENDKTQFKNNKTKNKQTKNCTKI